jgi:hypothetical protein
MLRGMDFDKFIPLFSKAKISLEEFLTIDDERLKEIGIELPYHRKTILLGLHDFFSEKWNNNSIWLPAGIKSHISPVDLIYVLVNVLRQTVVIKSQLLYLQKASQREGLSCDRSTLEHFNEFRNRIGELKTVLRGLEKTKRPLFIPKQSQTIKSNTSKESSLSGLVKKSIIAIPIVVLLSTVAVLYRK